MQKIADLMAQWLNQRVSVNNKPLTEVSLEMSADESGLVTITLIERPVSIARMVFYTPLILLRYRQLQVFATWPFKNVASALGEIEQLVAEDMQC
ncbi:hypothetical protein [Acidihalobacter ferrooxydans]|uniref:Uncharacterized protein n=1 Tax=Acidihalobacter ferrooxydans TaxID=1765967 RepID=A0A1P8UFF7_9GAMM|nr:hypothetical protein [Acidihalobacter ferrooxydans]APZ42573.1 hypothetical protein BW247_05240 [Acidihalobacter ferrooxydans]